MAREIGKWVAARFMSHVAREMSDRIRAALGGTISQIYQVGANSYVTDCDRMAGICGDRFKVPQQLRDLAASGANYKTTNSISISVQKGNQ